MSSRDQRQAAESELRSVEVHSEHLDVAEAPGPQATQIWALYPVMSPTPRESAAGTDWLRLALDAARRGRRLLIAGALAGFTLGGSYLALADAVYVVRTVLHVELRRSVVRDSDSRPGSGFIATQAEVFQSPALVTEAIRAIGLPEPKPPGLLASLKLRVASLLPFASQDPPGNPLDAAVLATLPMLQASPVVGTDVLNMTLRTVDPERGVRFLDALVSSYQSYVRENEAVAHREGLDVLRKREAELASAVQDVSARFEKREAEIRSLGSGEDALALGRTNLEEDARARADAQRHRVEVENELLALREGSDALVAPSQDILDDLARAEAELSELRARLSPRHPDVQQLEQRVAGLRAQMRQGTSVRIADLERQARAARRTEATLSALFDKEWNRVKSLEAERRELDELAAEKARLEQQRSAVAALMGEKELSLLSSEAAESSGTLVRVLEAPAVPVDPVWPLPIPVLAACSLVGALGGLALALLRQWRRERPAAAEASGYEESAARIPHLHA